jgi:hypothetical protein
VIGVELIGNGWVLAGALVVLGILVLVAPLPRVLHALRRTRSAAETLRTAITGRSRRVQVGLAELRAWRAAHRAGRSAEGEVGGSDASAVQAGDTGA